MELLIPNVSVRHLYHNHITPVRPGLTMSSHVQKLVPSLPRVIGQEQALVRGVGIIVILWREHIM